MNDDAPSKTILAAAWVASMAGPLIQDAGVAIQAGRICAVGTVRELQAAHPDAVLTDCGNAVLLPGLINAHVHLDLTGTPRPPGPISFPEWAGNLMAAAIPHKDPAHWLVKVAAGCKESLRCGVTACGDICGRFVSDIRAHLATEKIHTTSFGEVIGMGRRRHLAALRLAEATSSDFHDPYHSVVVGITPHAPYSIEPEGYRLCLRAAMEQNLPLATHLAELPYEAEFLSKHSGPLRSLWDKIGAWDGHVPTFQGGPVRYAQSLGLLDYPTLLAHVNYCDDDELTVLAQGKASVVYCPRTHQYFGHPPHRWRDMLSAGINVALGTDSSASSPDLNLVDDLRLVRQLAPDMPVETLWELITVRAAAAINDPHAGSLTPGKRADITAFRVQGSDPLRQLLESSALPHHVWIAGKREL